MTKIIYGTDTTFLLFFVKYTEFLNVKAKITFNFCKQLSFRMCSSNTEIFTWFKFFEIDCDVIINCFSRTISKQ